MSSNHDELTKLAREHMEKVKPYMSQSRGKRLKDVNCGMCKRKMTVREFEYHPYYCYKCDDELEGVLQ